MVNESCAFGDGFYSGGDGGWDFWGADEMFWGGGGRFDAMSQLDASGCYSAFGGGGGGGETCYQCHQRETRTCQSTYQSSLGNNTMALGGGTGACILAGAAGFIVGGLLCQVVVSGGVAIANNSAANVRDNCLANVASLCQSACNPR